MNNPLYRKVISTILALNVLITCGLNLEKGKNYTVINDLSNYDNDENNFTNTRIVNELPTVSLSNTKNDLLNKKITIDSEDIDKFKEYVKGIEVKYPYEEYYTAKYEAKKYIPSFSNDCIIKNNIVNEDKLYKYVIKNNENYLKTFGSSTYKNTTNAFVKKVCNIITKQLNKYLKNCELNVELLEEKLQNLCIFNFKSFAKGIYKQNSNILAINENDCTYEIIYHELDHLVQSASSNELKQNKLESRNGYCYKVTNDGINPYNWTWFIESCAESMAINDINEATVYTTELKMLEAMKLITLNSSNELEESLYLNDINKLYEYFSAYTEEEKQEINKMFYMITVINNYNPGAEGNEFYKKVKEDTGKSLAYTNYESELIGYVALTEAKIFYNNLISKMENKEFTLNDIFSIITTFEIEISRQTWYQSNYLNLEDFMKEYSNIQKNFFDVIGIKLNMGSNALSTIFNNYYTNFDVNNFNIKIDWLPLNTNNLLNYILDTRVNDKVNKNITSSNKKVSRS